MTFDIGDFVNVTKGPFEGDQGRIVGEDDAFGEHVVEFDDGETAVIPDDGLRRPRSEPADFGGGESTGVQEL